VDISLRIGDLGQAPETEQNFTASFVGYIANFGPMSSFFSAGHTAMDFTYVEFVSIRIGASSFTSSYLDNRFRVLRPLPVRPALDNHSVLFNLSPACSVPNGRQYARQRSRYGCSA
jgi:hypothetical protein